MKKLIFITALLISTIVIADVRIVEGESYFNELTSLLDEPNIKSLDIIQFRFSKIENYKLKTNIIYKKLLKLKNSAKIRIFLDNHNNGNKETIARLQKDGFEVRWTHGEQISHTKAMGINGDTLLFGSTNWTHTSLSYNNEINILVRNEQVARDYHKYFNTLWNDGASNRAFNFLMNNQSRLVTDREFHNEFLSLVQSAEKTIDIATYFFAYREMFKNGNDKLVGELIEAIAEQIKNRKVRVRFFLDYNGIPGKHSHTEAALNAIEYLKYLVTKDLTTDQKKSFVLLDVLEVHFDSFKKISHGKFIIVDNERMLTGSTNLYWKDISDNLQLNLYTENKSLIEKFTLYFEKKLAHAGHYYRFWRGIKRDVWNKDVVAFYQGDTFENKCLENALNRSENRAATSESVKFNYDDFECLLNLWLIPATPSYSAQTSLQAYLPVITNLNKPSYVHDEVAIIVYNNEREYNRLRSIGGKEGETYGPLHMDVFGQKDAERSSGSLIPKLFTGSVNLVQEKTELAVAYNLLNHATNWQVGTTLFRVLTKDEGMTIAEYKKSLEAYLTASQQIRFVQGHMIAISEKYAVEYVNFVKQSDISEFNKITKNLLIGLIEEETHITQELHKTKRDPLSYTPIRYNGDKGMAGNVVFKKGEKPGKVRHYRLE